MISTLFVSYTSPALIISKSLEESISKHFTLFVCTTTILALCQALLVSSALDWAKPSGHKLIIRLLQAQWDCQIGTALPHLRPIESHISTGNMRRFDVKVKLFPNTAHTSPLAHVTDLKQAPAFIVTANQSRVTLRFCRSIPQNYSVLESSSRKLQTNSLLFWLER